ncbi:MAG: AMP-binding protein [Ferroplasma sp.]|uniref:AMP-binding protein n=1 Tax=Ferroplasma sp. TaxID=2591003 RepID=UPI002816049F|nr:AMP-binding protein [Ferroplasma sp.]WMT50909.1 MAG: AMP-binding protein [Ferroplasma sp.]
MEKYEWFKIWPNYLPYTIDYPQMNIWKLMEISSTLYGSRDAIIYYGNHIKYGEINKAIKNLSLFINSMEICKGDRIGIMMQNSPQFIISFFAIARAGATIVLMSPALDYDTASYILKETGMKLIITTSELAKVPEKLHDEFKIPVICGSLSDYIKKPDIPVPDFIMGNYPTFGTPWNEAIKERTGEISVASNMDDEALIAYTSGTTGIPKGCIHTNKSVIANAIGASIWRRLTSSANELGAAPFFHVTGLAFSMLSPVYSGATVTILTRWNSEAAIQAIEKYKVTHFVSVAPMIVDLLNQKDLAERDFSSMRFIGGGGAAMPKVLAERMEELFHIPFVEGYGMTEAMGQTHINPPEHRKLQCIGIPQFGYDAKIVSTETGKVVKDETGEIVVSGPSLFKGYLNKPEDTEKAFITIEGMKFLRTGDIGYMDDDGSFFVVDRVKRMINRAGFKVWPAEIDSLMLRHPDILEVCTVGTPDPRVGEEVKAYIVLKNSGKDRNINEMEIIAWAKENIGGYKYPHIIEYTDTLPKTASGKIDWKKLQDKERKNQYK